MNLPDHRPDLFQAQDWMLALIGGVRPEHLDRPTPCGDWDVRELVAHLFMVADRIAVVGQGGNAMSVTRDGVQVPDDLAAGFEQRIQVGRQAWSDESSLSRSVVVPWGEVPGAIALTGYVPELVAHGWDLATATGQPSEAAPELAAVALRAAQRAIPAERDGFPFGPVVESGPDDSPTTRFVHWMGRLTPSPR
ncbi:TIGR03086 family metal-binding protein [uncultured Friedmanniella sp.]|uniref:TIGR03086 family metal-binding protein n=1 Tax=uncultured Friedmanniella sp. TaxID=335381 RepID=UPI0035CB69D3